MAAANFKDWQQQNHVFQQMVLVDGATYNMAAAGTTEKVRALQTQAGFFDLLGSRPQIGRTFNSAGRQGRGGECCILSAALWNRKFGKANRLNGQTVTLDGRVYSVIGVMPPDFDLPVAKFELWVPLAMNAQRWAERRDGHEYGAMARLRDGVSLRQAQAEMDQIAASLEQQYPATNSGSGVRLVPIGEEMVGNVRPALVAILGAGGLLLVIVCSNVAMLLLVRASGRRHEIAVRVALGASRRNLIAQLLTEGAVLATLGGVLGLALAWLGIPFLRIMPLDLPRLNQISLDWRVLAFSVFAVALCTVIVGLTPALQSLRSETASILNSGTRGGLDAGDHGTGKTLRAFVVVEMSLAVILMSGAGLLARSLWKVMIVDPGFNPERLLTADLSLATEQHLSAQQTLSFYGRLLDDVRSFPDVASAGLTTNLPIGGTSLGTSFSVEGRPAAASDFLASDQRIVSPGYFETMEIPLVSGRLFADHDTPDAVPVAIINDAFARRYFPGENPIGQRVKWGRPVDKDLPVVVHHCGSGGRRAASQLGDIHLARVVHVFGADGRCAVGNGSERDDVGRPVAQFVLPAARRAAGRSRWTGPSSRSTECANHGLGALGFLDLSPIQPGSLRRIWRTGADPGLDWNLWRSHLRDRSAYARNWNPHRLRARRRAKYWPWSFANPCA